jgi:ribonuclease D
VRHNAELDDALARLDDAPEVALDTEFMRERTYYPQLCLIQLASCAACVLIDPLSVTNLDALHALLGDRQRLKILHAARQDLEVLRLASGSVPGPLFDTQIAAGLLGMPAQIGLADLVRQVTGHDLPKGHARTDWARRPLSDAQLAYAADDVRFLLPLQSRLCTALAAAGRLDWLAAESRVLETPGLYETRPEDAWLRLKGLDRLTPAQRAAAVALAAWRETRARESDKPRGWILSDVALRGIADQLPGDVRVLEASGVPPGLARRRGEELITLVQDALRAVPQDSARTRPARPDPRDADRVTRLMRLVRAEADKLHISQELLATRRDVERLVYTGDPGDLMRGWREEVIGRTLVAAAGQR